MVAGPSRRVLAEVRALSESPRLAHNDHVYMATDAVLSASSGDLDGAERALARLNGIGLTRIPRSSSWLATQFIAAEAAYLVGDSGVANDVARTIQSYAHLPVMPSLAVVCLGSAERALGLAAATVGDLDAAAAHLHAAIGTDQRLGNRPMAAITRHTLAQVLAAHGGDGDRATSRRLAERAAATAAEMGIDLPDIPPWLVPPKPSCHQVGVWRDPTGWQVRVDGRTTVVSDHVGLRYLAALLAAPKCDQHVLRLLFGSAGPLPDVFELQEVLDRDAMRSLQDRAGLLADRQSAADEEELKGIQETLRTSTGLHGRSRTFTTDQERARTSVRKALMRAIDLIERTEAPFASHLPRADYDRLHLSLPTGGGLVRPGSQLVS